MKILLIVSNFIPEIGSAAHIYYDLASAFVKNGHEVHVITSYPRQFYLEKNDVNKQFPLDETVNGIRIHRYKPKLISRDNVILRGLEHFILPFAYFSTYLWLRKTKFDVCLIYIPPLPLYYLGRVIKWVDKTPYVLNIQDFHPQELVDVGMLKNKLLIWLMEFIERSSYRHADRITVMSSLGKDLIVSRGGDPKKITHIYNSIDPGIIKIVKKDFKRSVHAEDKFLVTYAGILSPFQGLDDILNAAKLMKNHEDIIFYVVGDGMEKARLEKRVADEAITNLKILPLQPRSEYYNIVNSSDICIVTLDKRMTAPCMPGKFINILSLKKPLLACTPKENEVSRIINKNHCGIVVMPGCPESLANSILLLKNDPEYSIKLGNNGFEFLLSEMNINNSISTYEGIFISLIANGTYQKVVEI